MRTSTRLVVLVAACAILGACSENEQTYQDSGDTYLHRDEYQKAIAEYNMAIEFDPPVAAAYYNRGNAYCRLGLW